MSRRLLWGVALLLAAVVLGFVATGGFSGPVDRALIGLVALREDSSPAWLIAAARFVSSLGNDDVRSIVVILVCGVLIARHCWRSAAVYLLTVTLSIWGYVLAKAAFGRARPHVVPWLDGVSDLSYPSGHAAGAMVVLLAAALLMRERWLVWPALGIAVAIGATRPMLGVHWPSDVIGGWLWGAGFALIGSGVATLLRLPRPGLLFRKSTP